MKVCPKCGYTETIPWRQNRWRTHVEFCWLEQFRDFYPDIYSRLLKGEIVTDDYYAYRLAGKGKNLVERILKDYYIYNGPQGFTQINHEKCYRKYLPPTQRKLFEENLKKEEG